MAKGGKGMENGEELGHTQRMAAAQLRFLRVFTLQFIADTVKQLHVTLLRVLLECGDEGPRHGARCLACDLSVLPTQSQNHISRCKYTVVRKGGAEKT